MERANETETETEKNSLSEFLKSIKDIGKSAHAITELLINEGVHSVNDLKAWKIENFTACGLKPKKSQKIVEACQKIPPLSPMEQFLRTIIGEDLSPILEKLKSNGITSTEKLKQCTVEKMRTIGIKMNHIVKIKTPEITNKEQATQIVPKNTIAESPPKAIVSYVLKTAKLESLPQSALPKPSSEFKHFYCNNELYLEFEDITKRKAFFVKNPQIEINQSMIPLFECVFFRLRINTEIKQALIRNKDFLTRECQKLADCQLLPLETEKETMIFYNNSPDFTKSLKEINSMFGGLILEETTDFQFKLKEMNEYNALVNKLLVDLTKPIGIQHNCLIYFEPCKRRDIVPKMFVVGYNTEDITGVISEIIKLQLTFARDEVYIPFAFEESTKSGTSGNKRKKIDNNENVNDDEDKADPEIFKRILIQSNEKIKKSVESRFKSAILTNVQIDHKENGSSFSVSIKVLGFNQKEVIQAQQAFSSELCYEQFIDFSEKGDEPLKGAFVKGNIKELRTFSMTKGASIYVQYNKYGDKMESNVKLRGLKSGVIETREKILSMLENFNTLKGIEKKKFFPLRDKDDRNTQRYTKCLEFQSRNLIKHHIKENLPNCWIELDTLLSPNWEMEINYEVCSNDNSDLTKIKETVVSAINEVKVEEIPSQKPLIMDIRSKKFDVLKFCKENKIDIVTDFPSILLIGCKENIAVARASLTGVQGKKFQYKLNKLHQFYVERYLENSSYLLNNIAATYKVRIFPNKQDNSILVFGKQNEANAALKEIKILEDDIIKKSVTESVACTKDEIEILNKNKSEIVAISKRCQVEIMLMDKPICVNKAQTIFNNGIKVIVKEGNIIADQEVEAIVNSANERLMHNGGVARDIAAAAGPSLINESENLLKGLKKLAVCDVVTTTAGNLKFKHILHAVVPQWRNSSPDVENQLVTVVTNILNMANKLNIAYLAMPCLCSGIYGFPQHLAASIIIKTVCQYQNNKTIKEIHLVDTSKGAIESFAAILQQSEKSAIIIPKRTEPNWEPSYQWYWDHNEEGIMEAYDEDQNYQIEYAYLFEFPKGNTQMRILGDLKKSKNNRNYIILFNEMQQMNEKTGFKRKLERKLINNGQKAIHKRPENVDKEEESVEILESSPHSYIIIAEAQKYIDKAKFDIAKLLESYMQICERKQPKVFTREQEKEIYKIAEETGCNIMINKEHQLIIFKGYSDQIKNAEAEFWKYVASLQTETFSLPEYWSPQKDDLEIIDIPANDKQYIDVLGAFNKTMRGFYTSIIRLQRIQNYRLWYNFAYEMKKLKMKYGYEAKRLSLFHGTRATDPSQIYGGTEDAFDMRFSNSGMWGTGVYFAVNAKYSNDYRSITNKGEYQMFVADVIVGDSIQCASNPTLRLPPLKIGSKSERYDSVTGITNGSQVYIVYANSKAYPQYLITYK